jgi:toxin secretion/phage lysis holin
MGRLIAELSGNIVFELVLVAVVMDTLFGAGRAIKQHKFNSSVGIDGAIRKSSMLLSLVFLFVVDSLTHLNLIGFIPDEVKEFLPQIIIHIGLLEFFGLLYLCYEVVSILKNMTLCGLPVKKLWETVRGFLGKYTEELPDTVEQDEAEEMEVVKE